MKVTKKMMQSAVSRHFNSETYPSLVTSSAYQYLYYKQQGQPKIAKQFITDSDVRKKVAQLEKKKAIKRRVKSQIGNSSWIAKEMRFD